jgi:hypothetical protein
MLEQTSDIGQFVKNLVIHSWNSKTLQTTRLWDKLAPWALELEIVPEGNKVIYLLGHLLAVQDRMIEGMLLGKRLYPELDDVFLIPQTPDHRFPDASDLRRKWDIVNQVLQAGIEESTLEHWLSRHFYVSEQEFIMEPYRNVLNLLLSRTSHLAHHIGQLALVKPTKKEKLLNFKRLL